MVTMDNDAPKQLAARLARVEHCDDVLEFFSRCLLALAPALSDEVTAAGRQVRDTFGGERVHIARRPGEGRSARNEAIRRDFQRGERVPLLMRRYSLSRWQITRVLKAEM